MIGRIEARWRYLRRRLSRSEWAIGWLGLSRSEETSISPGLVLIQIDGFGRRDFDNARAAGRLPFLSHLLAHERYRLHDLYAGVPSTTPAVQAELFYGARTSVPAFAFYDRERGEIVHMFEPAAAHDLEEKLGAARPGLMQGGSAYGNIFSGGADDAEAHFCVSALVWDAIRRTVKPLSAVMLILSNPMSVLRTLTLLVIETVLACYDFVRGLGRNSNILKELKFIPTRVAVCIGLRELIVIGAKIDVARGLPIVQLNLAAYDEQSHRRGPDAAFAHWALRGIDRAVKRVWHAAKDSTRRDYHVWIHSDHGQEHVVPYEQLTGHSIEATVTRLFEARASHARVFAHGVQTLRAQMLTPPHARRRLAMYSAAEVDASDDAPRVVAMGPIGFVYLPAGYATDANKAALARRLVDEASVPAVLISETGGTLRAFITGRTLELPLETGILVGEDHPFAAEVAADIAALCAHSGAGDLVLCGWRKGAAPLSFAIENGAHGGFGPHETNGMAILDAACPLPPRAYPHVRASDIGEAGRALLGRPVATARAGAACVAGRDPQHLRVVTYNAHACLGMDGKRSPARIARVIRELDPDIVAVQELERGRLRSGGVDQAAVIAALLSMDYFFHPVISDASGGDYGNALLSRLPLRLVRSAALPGHDRREPRGAMWASVDCGQALLQVLCTHLSLNPRDRRRQTETLLGSDWLGAAESAGPVVLLGDLNASPWSPVCRALDARLHDAQRHASGWQPRNTWFARRPTLRIDHIYVSRVIHVETIDVPQTLDARLASDHLPLLAALRLPTAQTIKYRTAERATALPA